MKGKLFIISSPSGGGKGTLIREILKIVSKVTLSVSFTTRPKRPGEEHGKDYFFVSESEFLNLIKKNAFLEYAKVHGHFYGTSREYVEEKLNAGQDVILEIDIQGARSIKKLPLETISIFIMPPSFQILRERLIARGTESEQSLKIRLENAINEVEAYKEFDYVVINDNLHEAIENLKAIFVAERLRTQNQLDRIDQILHSFKITSRQDTN
jgi:guanylate kinase